MAYSGDDQNGSGNGWRAAPQEPTPALGPELNRVLSAAVVSAAFRRLLLSDPVAALTGGYNGESFEIQADELAQIVMIQAGSLAEFAGELLDRLWHGRSESKTGPVQRQWSGAGPLSVAVGEPVAAYAGGRLTAAPPVQSRRWVQY